MLRFEIFLLAAFSLAALRAAINSVPFARSGSPAAIHRRMRLSALWNAIEAYAARQPACSLKQAHFMLSRTSLCPILQAFSRSLGKFFSRESFFLSPSKPAMLYLE